MEAFFPSEIARLVLGYLEEEKCLQSWQTFLEESSNLKEYFSLYNKGKVYSTNVNGNSLLDILNEYCVLKSEAISNGDDKAKTSGKAYHDSESEFFKTIRNDIFAETTKNAADLVFQKYLSSVHNNRSSSSSDLTTKVSSSESSDASCGNKEKQKSYNTNITKNASEIRVNECGNKQNNAVSTIEIKQNEIINRNKGHKQNTILHNLNRGESNVEKNITEENNDSTSEQLNISRILSKTNISCYPINSTESSSSKLLNVRGTANAKDKDLQSSNSITHNKCKNDTDTSGSIIGQINTSDSLINDSSVNRDLCNTNNKLPLVVENLSTADLELTDKKNVVSPVESVQIDDDELKIIEEVKKDNLNNRIQMNTRSTSHSNQATTNSHSSNSKPIINIQTSNNVAVCNVQNRVTQKTDSKQKVDSSKNNPLINIQVSNIRSDGINQSAVCNVQNKVNEIDNSEHKVNSSNDQASCKVNNSSLLIQPAPVSEMPLISFPRYILPRYASNGPFINNNNAQFYFVLNTPGASNEPTINGTLLTVPRFQANNVPILPATSINNVSNPMPTAPVASAVSGISLTATDANKNVLTVSNVSNPMLAVSTTTAVSKNTLAVSNVTRAETSIHAVSCNRRSQAMKSQRILSRVSYAEFPDDVIEPDESETPKASKRKKISLKSSAKKKNKASMSKKQNIDEGNLLILSQSQDVQKALKTKRKRRKESPYKKKKAKKGKSVLSTEQPVHNIEQHFEKEHVLHSSDFPAKTKESAPTKLIDCIPVSTSPSSHNNSDQSSASETMSENACHSSILSDCRVLKVVLSDMFSECSQELNPLHNQCLNSNSDLVRCNDDNKDRVSDLEKLAVQNRKSPRIKSKISAKHSCESKNMDSVSVQQKEKVAKPPNLSDLTDEKKVDPSNGRSERNKCTSTFNMTSAVLNSMEQAVKHCSVFFDSNESNLESSSKDTAKNEQEPTAKLTFQNIMQDAWESAECVKLENTASNDKESIQLSTVDDSTLPSSQDVEKNLDASSTKEIRENHKNPTNLIHHEDDGSMVSKDVIVKCENNTSVSDDSDPEKCSNLSQKVMTLEQNKKTEKTRIEQRNEISDKCEKIAPVSGDSDFENCNNLKVFKETKKEQNNETEGVISLDISKKDFPDIINEEKQVVVNDCIVEKEQRILPKSVSSLHHVNVNSKFKTVVARKLNFGEKYFDHKTWPNVINDSVRNDEKKREDMEDSRNSSHCEILKAGSDSFNITNAKEDSSGFMCQTSKNNTFSDLTSMSADTNVLSIAGKLHSENTGTSSIIEKNVINAILPSTSKHPIESLKDNEEK